MFIGTDEQETVINFGRTDDRVILYTSDRTWMTKLDNFVRKNPKDFRVIEENEVSKRYEFPKSLLSIRTKKREMTEEQREMLSERMSARKYDKESA